MERATEEAVPGASGPLRLLNEDANAGRGTAEASTGPAGRHRGQPPALAKPETEHSKDDNEDPTTGDSATDLTSDESTTGQSTTPTTETATATATATTTTAALAEYPYSVYNQGTWTAAEDRTLLEARAGGQNWAELQRTHFPGKTANACRKRYERLVERRGIQDRGGRRLERVAGAYMAMRREIWGGLAARLGMKWEVVEALVSLIRPGWAH